MILLGPFNFSISEAKDKSINVFPDPVGAVNSNTRWLFFNPCLIFSIAFFRIPVRNTFIGEIEFRLDK